MAHQLLFQESILNNMESFTIDCAPNELLFGRKTSMALDLKVEDRPLAGEIVEIREVIHKEAKVAIKVTQECIAQ